MSWDVDAVAGHACTEAGPDIRRELVALLRRAQGWRLTATQSADLDEILTELERSAAEHPGLCGLRGDLRILDATARWSPGNATTRAISPEQRTRIDALVSAKSGDVPIRTEKSDIVVPARASGRRWWSARRQPRAG